MPVKKTSSKSRTKKASPKKHIKSTVKGMVKRVLKPALIGAGVAAGTLASVVAGLTLARQYKKYQQDKEWEKYDKQLQIDKAKEREKEAKKERYFREVLKSGEGNQATMARKLQSTLPRLPVEIQLNILEKMNAPSRGISCASSGQMYQICKRYFKPEWVTKLNNSLSIHHWPRERHNAYAIRGIENPLVTIDKLNQKYIKNIDDYISLSLMIDYINKHPYREYGTLLHGIHDIKDKLSSQEFEKLHLVVLYVMYSYV
jgi:hypothetical protein